MTAINDYTTNYINKFEISIISYNKYYIVQYHVSLKGREDKFDVRFPSRAENKRRQVTVSYRCYKLAASYTQLECSIHWQIWEL